jgi:hypothetical protein
MLQVPLVEPRRRLIYPIKLQRSGVERDTNPGVSHFPTAMVQSGNVTTYPGPFHNSYDGFKAYYDDQRG